MALALLGSTALQAQTAVEVWPTTRWATSTPAAAGMSSTRLTEGVNAATLLQGSGMVVRRGRRVARWGDQTRKYTLFSATKSFGSIALGLALADGLTTLQTPLLPELPELTVPVPDVNSAAWLPLVTLEQLATHSAGFDKAGGVVALLFQPGTRWFYSDSGPNWIADYLTVRFGQDLATFMRSRVFALIGIPSSALTWRLNRYRPGTLRGINRREFGSGISANVDALARIGLFLLRGGRWTTGQILPPGYVTQATSRRASIARLPLHDPSRYPNAQKRYGLMFWSNRLGTLAGVPTDAFWAWGLGDQVIVVVPSLDLVIVRAGPSSKRPFGDSTALQSFVSPIVQAVIRTNTAPTAAAGPDTVLAAAGTVLLEGDYRDDGLPGQPATFAWSQVSGPAAVVFQVANQLDAVATLTAPGTYVLRLTVNDGQLSGSDDVAVTVPVPNTAPVVAAGPDQQLVRPGVARLTGSYTDDGLPGGAPVALWSLVSGPAPVSFAPVDQLVVDATFSLAGTYVLQLAVNDGQLVGVDQVTVVVAAGRK